MTRTMKDSGVEWIGQIPEDWEFHKLKYHIHIKSGDMLTKSDLTDDGIFPVYGGGEMIGYANKSNTKCNQILIGRVGARCGCVTLPEKDCWATDNALVITSLLPIKLLYYSLVAADLNNINISNAQPLITGNKVKNIIIPFPPLPEQQAIADYLDDKCAQIDNITATINEQIDVLKQYKKSVITEAVTKGLDPNVPMKDSGLEWIGQIPEHWKVVRLKYLGTCNNGLTYKPSDLVEPNEGVIVLRSSNIKEGKLVFNDNVYVDESIAINSMLKEGDILICSRNGSRELIGKNTVIPKGLKAGFGAFMMVYRTNSYNYIHKILNSHIFSYYLGTFFTSTINQLTTKNFENMKIVYTPYESEQQTIADYLDDKCSQIDAVIADKQAQLEILAAYKKSLIYEYVTGKKSVPGFEEA